eukprot:Nk52_evm28s249 gene=Nk52_evmTU28s249
MQADNDNNNNSNNLMTSRIDIRRSRYPFCVVWTPLPLLSWFFPVIGHVGIATSAGIIRDFAGSYYVSEDEMAFGEPTRYWPLSPHHVTVKYTTGGESTNDIVSMDPAYFQSSSSASHSNNNNNNIMIQAGGNANPSSPHPLSPEREPLSGDYSTRDAQLVINNAHNNNSQQQRPGFSVEDLAAIYNEAIAVASGEYSKREHQLLVDNCHSHVARALNLMGYEGRRDWTMVRVAVRIVKDGRWVSNARMLKTLLPFVLFVCVVVILVSTLLLT